MVLSCNAFPACMHVAEALSVLVQAPEWQGDLLDSIMDIMQTCPDGLVLPASEPAPPMRLDRNIMLTLAVRSCRSKLTWKL